MHNQPEATKSVKACKMTLPTPPSSEISSQKDTVTTETLVSQTTNKPNNSRNIHDRTSESESGTSEGKSSDDGNSTTESEEETGIDSNKYKSEYSVLETNKDGEDQAVFSKSYQVREQADGQSVKPSKEYKSELSIQVGQRISHKPSSISKNPISTDQLSYSKPGLDNMKSSVMYKSADQLPLTQNFHTLPHVVNQPAERKLNVTLPRPKQSVRFEDIPSVRNIENISSSSNISHSLPSLNSPSTEYKLLASISEVPSPRFVEYTNIQPSFVQTQLQTVTPQTQVQPTQSAYRVSTHPSQAQPNIPHLFHGQAPIVPIISNGVAYIPVQMSGSSAATYFPPNSFPMYSPTSPKYLREQPVNTNYPEQFVFPPNSQMSVPPLPSSVEHTLPKFNNQPLNPHAHVMNKSNFSPVNFNPQLRPVSSSEMIVQSRNSSEFSSPLQFQPSLYFTRDPPHQVDSSTNTLKHISDPPKETPITSYNTYQPNEHSFQSPMESFAFNTNPLLQNVSNLPSPPKDNDISKPTSVYGLVDNQNPLQADVSFDHQTQEDLKSTYKPIYNSQRKPYSTPSSKSFPSASQFGAVPSNETYFSKEQTVKTIERTSYEQSSKSFSEQSKHSSFEDSHVNLRKNQLLRQRPISESFTQRKFGEPSARLEFLNQSLETLSSFSKTQSTDNLKIERSSNQEESNLSGKESPTSPTLPSVNYATLPTQISSPSWMEIFEATPPLLESYGLATQTAASSQNGQSTGTTHSATTNSATTVSDKKKFFEKAMEESVHPSPKPERAFTFLSQDEVEKMKQEEDKKIASLSKSELKTWSRGHTDEEDLAMDVEAERSNTGASPPGTLTSMGSIRTAKAERRMKERLIQEGLLSDEEENELSPAEQRALRAEKRAAWRQARLKSLEQDALQAQMVIKKMSEMIEGRTVEEPAENNNQLPIDHQNNISEVETTREKIISLELSTGERTEEESEHSATSPTSPLPPETTPTNTEEATSKRRRRKKSKKGH